MDISLFALIVAIVFICIMAALFLVPLIEVTVNGIVLYLLFIRIYTEMTKYKRADLYVKCALVAGILMLLFGNYIPTWRITTWIFTTFALAHAYLAVKT